LTITADCGGGNSPRVHLWKVGLQRLAHDTGLELELCHFPPGTSKWNKVEHRLFSFVSLNWRGRPLTSYQVILDLIASTTTSTSLKVYARLDPTVYTMCVGFGSLARRVRVTALCAAACGTTIEGMARTVLIADDNPGLPCADRKTRRMLGLDELKSNWAVDRRWRLFDAVDAPAAKGFVASYAAVTYSEIATSGS